MNLEEWESALRSGKLGRSGLCAYTSCGECSGMGEGWI